jgi:hypothetical protein
MEKIFSVALIAQTLCIACFIIHRFFKPLGSDFMFGVLILSLVLGAYLLWHSFRNSAIVGLQKTLGIVLGCVPLLWLLALVLFVSSSKM